MEQSEGKTWEMPDGAILEATMGDVALYDVSHLLLQHDDKRYRRRNPDRVNTLLLHHSGRLSQNYQGFRGMYNSARFVVKQRKDPRDGTIGWPGFAYPSWVPYGEVLDAAGRAVWFRGQPDNVRCWHTGGLNAIGWAICLQGSLTKDPMSPHQKKVLRKAVPWARRRFKVPKDRIIGHCDAGRFGGKSKPACPGSHVETWLAGYLTP